MNTGMLISAYSLGNGRPRLLGDRLVMPLDEAQNSAKAEAFLVAAVLLLPMLAQEAPVEDTHLQLIVSWFCSCDQRERFTIVATWPMDAIRGSGLALRCAVARLAALLGEQARREITLHQTAAMGLDG